MILRLDDALICEITVHWEPDGETYVVTHPDRSSPVFSHRGYLRTEITRLVWAAVRKELDREHRSHGTAA